LSQPVLIESPHGPCLGWFHAPSAPARDAVVVMCRPIGYEALCSYHAYTQLAQAFAAAGLAVLRFDWHGTGDSDGGDTDPERTAAWLASGEAAIAKARELAGTQEVVLFGMRLGATLALQLAQRIGGIHSLVLWAPCASGRQFVREMRAAYASHAHASPDLDGGLEALGTLFTCEALAGIEALAAESAGPPPAQRVYVVGRDDLPGEGSLPARLRTQGAQVEVTRWSGYAAMMAEPHDARVAPDAVASLVQWLMAPLPSLATARAAAAAPPWPEAWRTGGVQEAPVRFGERGELFGMLSQPLAPAQRAETAVLLLNVGGNYRIGCNRIYVKIARDLASCGWRALRLDVAGVGDSRVEEGFTSASMFRDYATADIAAAIDMLARQGCKRFVLLGICSGAYLGFQVALQDARVNAQMIINARLLEWDEERNGSWQASMQQYYKSTRYYRQALLRGDVYARLLRGQVDVRGIAGRFVDLAGARLRSAWDRLLGRVPREGVLPKMEHLCARGVDTLVAVSEEDDSLDYIELHLGHRCRRMRAHRNFRMELIKDADHTFSTVASQRAVMRVVREQLERMQEPQSVAAPVLPRTVAST
jgi:pimeloyl-ACP methyl ester carboxylesterase